jgi:hypothetical protein
MHFNFFFQKVQNFGSRGIIVEYEKKFSVAINQCRRPGYRSFLNPEKGLISIPAGAARGWQAVDSFGFGQGSGLKWMKSSAKAGKGSGGPLAKYDG